MDDMTTLIANLRSLARFEHADLSIGDEAADALEVARIVDEERAHFARRCLRAERRLSIATQALEIIAGKRQCLDNLMGNRDVADEAMRLIAADDGDGGAGYVVPATDPFKRKEEA